MNKTYHLFLLIVLLFNVSAALDSILAQPIIKIEIDPDVRNIRIGDALKEIVITTRTNKQNLQFKWDLKGPGKLAGNTTSPGILYVPPSRITGKSAQVTVSVTVSDRQGGTTSARVTFTLLAGKLEKPTPTPQMTPTATPEVDREKLKDLLKGTATATPTQTPTPTPTPKRREVNRERLREILESKD